MPIQYIIKALRADDPQKPRNVAFVEADSAVAGLKALFRAAHGGTRDVNAAVWADRPAILDGDIDGLSECCDEIGFGIENSVIDNPQNPRALRRIFREVALTQWEEESMQPLFDHIQGRLDAIAQAFPGKAVSLTVRANRIDTIVSSVDKGNPHTDKGAPGRERFIETLVGGGTCLIGAEDINYEKIKPVLQDGPITYWQMGAGHLGLLTSDFNAARAIVHTAPPLPDIENFNNRIVVIYDVQDKAPSLLRRVGGWLLGLPS